MAQMRVLMERQQATLIERLTPSSRAAQARAGPPAQGARGVIEAVYRRRCRAWWRSALYARHQESAARQS